MVVKAGLRITGKRVRDDSGQSVLEFLFLLPMLIGLTVVLIRINSAIQVSIVNQQYARSQTLFLAFNSPVYPQSEYREKFFVQGQSNRMVIGVSDNVQKEDEAEYVPEATTQNIARNRRLSGGEGPAQSEPVKRGMVRVRSTVALCTPLNVIKEGGGSYVSASPMKETTPPSAFDYCRSPLDE